MKRHGYTFIELLSVLVVVSVLAIGLLPVLARNVEQTHEQENARRRQCGSNLKQIALAVMQYAQDFDEKYPLVSTTPGRVSNFAGSGQPFLKAFGWADVTSSYTHSTKVYQCPSDRYAFSNNPKRAGYTDYWLNSNLAGQSFAALDSVAQTVLSGDGDGGSAASTSRYAINKLPRAWLNTPGSPARRHTTGGIYAFADGHVKWLKPERVTTAKTSAVITSRGGTFSIKIDDEAPRK